MDVELLDYYGKPDENASEIYRYEYKLRQQRNEQKSTMLSAIKKTLSFAYRCILIACVIEIIFSSCQDLVASMISGILPVNSAVINIPLTGMETIVFLFVTELITTYLGEKHPDILSLSDSLGKISKLRREFRYIRDREIPPEEEEPKLMRAEPCASSAPIDFITTNQLKRYLAYKKKCLRDGNRVFTESVLPAQAPDASLPSDRIAEPGELFMADTSDRRILKQLVRDEELHARSYGMIYQSPFNTVLVDPVVNVSASPQRIFPYERVIPTQGDGAVIMTRCRGSLLLLRQFRHALGSWQYSFPRGFAEQSDRDPVDTARRELEEELGAKCIDNPIFLGKIAPDSGLTSRQTYIFFVDIDSFSEKKGYEEIGRIRLVSEEELQKLILSGDLNDGYSIGAYELFRLYRKARAGKLPTRKDNAFEC